MVTTVQVLLTPRALGGHEKALFGWLADAQRLAGLPADAAIRIAVPGARLLTAALEAGLAESVLVPLSDDGARMAALRLLLRWPRQVPLLLAPGVLHAQASLLGAALAAGHRPWIYVPMTYTAATMGYRAGPMRDAMLAPLLRAAAGFVTIDEHQARQLREDWCVTRPIHVVPNQPRVGTEAPPPWPAVDPQGLLRVAFVGCFDVAMKGLDWLSTQLRGAAPEGLDRCRWWFQGEGPGASTLEALARELGPQRVTVRPFAPIATALAHNDMLLLASSYEEHPLVALDATALGWPVVATRSSRLGDLLTESCLYDFSDAAGLAFALQGLRSIAAREAAVAHARARLAAHLQSDAYQPALVHPLDATAAPQRGPRRRGQPA